MKNIKTVIKKTSIIGTLPILIYACGDINNNTNPETEVSAPIIETLKVDESQNHFAAKITNATLPNRKLYYKINCMRGSKVVKVYQNMVDDIFGIDKIGPGDSVKCKVFFSDNTTLSTNYSFSYDKNIGRTDVKVYEGNSKESRKYITLSAKDVERTFTIKAKNSGTTSVFANNITYTEGRDIYNYDVRPDEVLVNKTGVDNIFQLKNNTSFSLHGKNIKKVDQDGYVRFYLNENEIVDSAFRVHLTK